MLGSKRPIGGLSRHMDRVGQNRIYIYIYIYVYLHRIFGEFQTKNTVCTPYIYGSGQPYRWRMRLLLPNCPASRPRRSGPTTMYSKATMQALRAGGQDIPTTPGGKHYPWAHITTCFSKPYRSWTKWSLHWTKMILTLDNNYPNTGQKMILTLDKNDPNTGQKWS